MPRILIIDDEPDIAEFQKSYFTKRKYEVLVAVNTKDALEKIKNDSPDIVLCDVRLDSDRAGLEILSEAKKIKPNIVVFLITGLLEKDIHDQGLALGAKEVLTKPISAEELENKIKAAIS